MEPLAAYSEMVMYSLILSFLAPVVTSLILAMAILRPGAPFARRFLFHMVVMPLLFGVVVLCFRLFYTAFNGLFFYTIFITAMYLYLQVSRAVRWFRNGRHS